MQFSAINILESIFKFKLVLHIYMYTADLQQL